MKIVLTGGGSGGHFYPLIAVAQEIRKISRDEKVIQPEIYFFSNDPYDARALFDLDIKFQKIPAGKIRRYFSILNFFDLFKTLSGIIKSLWKMFKIYPDVVFAKGAYVSFPTLFSAKVLGIPVVIHESDSKPGRVNAWAGKFAKHIAISYPQAVDYFKNKERVAWTGNPIRPEIAFPQTEGGRELLGIKDNLPVLLILGGSQGSVKINDVIMESLSNLIEKYYIIHQTGKEHFEEIKRVADITIGYSPNKDRYKPFDYLNLLSMRMSAGVADLVISRAGSTIFEIASWGKPSIIIPIPESISHDQTKNAFNYARSGACHIIEENNLTSEILTTEIERIVTDDKLRNDMISKAKAFSKTDSARIIAKAIIEIGISHEK
jgi:UDP-N-acetylglucosamine--N-acetylmuramyl-(pentapeptide) pyrophosphoryl-undecaprenol N-acetylglucosamine transferase